MGGGLRAATRRISAIVAAVASLALLLAPVAVAHPYLVASTPESGVVATGSVSSVQLAFTERLVLEGSSVTVLNPQGYAVHVGRLRSALGGNGFTASVGNLPEGVYTVKWVALGDDGHTVAGSFAFGVPGANGQAPAGAGKLLASTVGNGSESAPTESFVSIAGRWLAAIAAFVLLGGAVLLFRLRMGAVGDDSSRSRIERRWLRFAPVALGGAVLGTLAECYERARAPQGGFRLGLLTASTSDVAVLVRLAALLVGLVALRLVPSRWRPLLLAGTGAVALAALGIDGHMASAPVLNGLSQSVHLLSAGVWVGGVLVLAAFVAPVARAASDPGATLAAARAFTPVALVAAAMTVVTGLIAAWREVGRWYFLRWSTYGHLVLVKGGLVLIVLALGGTTTLLARRAGRPSRFTRGLLAGEAVIAVGVIAVASTLAGTLQGRGQPLPSQRGNLLPGAGFADVALQHSIAEITLAPARPGLNRVVVALAPPDGPRGTTPPAPPRSVKVSLSCACGSPPIGLGIPLHPGAGGRDAWVGQVELPLGGVWSAELKVDGQPTIGNPTFDVGVTHTPGSTPLTVASVADLSGPDALECRSQELGALLSIELMNVVGGVGGGKINQEVLDDGGNPALARSEALSLARQHPVAFLDPCGQGASAAIGAVGDEIPTIVGDPSVPTTAGTRVFRFAPNPYAEGYASGEYIGRDGIPAMPKTTPRVVAALVEKSPASQERLHGLQAGLAKYGVSVKTYPAGGPGLVPLLRRLLPATSSLAIYLDGQFGPLTSALRTVGNETQGKVNPTAVLPSSRLASESFIEASGDLGREGQIRFLTDVDPTSSGAQTYAMLASQVVGELPSLPGLSGFVSGQALAYGLLGGTSASAIAARLREPAVFSQAAISPWDAANPSSGTDIFRVFEPSFLTDNLIPVGNGDGGEVDDGQFFPDGEWEPGATSVFTPLRINLGPAPALGGTSYDRGVTKR
jgi:methionine-rich copper-binding protein CopC/putative copper export protein/ABC-type branched-subunit amino acid transport system substrate-binding protein